MLFYLRMIFLSRCIHKSNCDLFIILLSFKFHGYGFVAKNTSDVSSRMILINISFWFRNSFEKQNSNLETKKKNISDRKKIICCSFLELFIVDLARCAVVFRKKTLHNRYYLFYLRFLFDKKITNN